MREFLESFLNKYTKFKLCESLIHLKGIIFLKNLGYILLNELISRVLTADDKKYYLFSTSLKILPSKIII